MSDEKPSMRERVSELVTEAGDRVRDRRGEAPGRRVEDTMSDLRRTMGMTGGGPSEVRPLKMLRATFEEGPVRMVMATREGIEVALRINPPYHGVDECWHFTLSPSAAVAIAGLTELMGNWAVTPPVMDRLDTPALRPGEKERIIFGEDQED